MAQLRCDPVLQRRWVHEIILQRRAALFRRLIFTPLLISFAIIGLGAGGHLPKACFSWLVGSVVGATLELIGSYYLAGMAVSFATWVRFGPFDRFLMLRLSVLGLAGATASIACATSILAERCAL